MPDVLFDGRIVLHQGDCVELIGAVGPVAHVFTDPPFEKTLHDAKAGGRSLRTDGGQELGALDFEPIDRIRPIITPPLVDMCSGWLLAFCTPEGIAPWRDAIEAAGARYKRACFWHKPDAAPQFNGQGPGFAVEPFVTAWCGPGFSRWNGGGRGNWFSHHTHNPTRTGEHKTEKPVSLMLELVEQFTKPDDLVFDPFMGTGTTGVACAMLGRRFVGIEIQPRYYQIAHARIDAAARQPDFFITETQQKPRQLKMGVPR